MFDEGRNKVITHATSVTEFWEERMDQGVGREEWRYRGEYVFMFEFEGGRGEKAGKINKVVEFVDSLGTERLRVD
jgi:ketosteroid isomerase-like protein